MFHSRNNLRNRIGRSRRPAHVVSSIVLALLIAPLTVNGAPGSQPEDLKTRRGHVIERLGPDGMAILWSAPPKVYSTDVDYEYRQESNLLYLTGIDQEDTILVLMPGNETRKEILFVR